MRITLAGILAVSLRLASCSSCPDTSYETDNILTSVYDLDVVIESIGYPGEWENLPERYEMYHYPGDSTYLIMSFWNDGCNDTWLSLTLVFNEEGVLQDHEVSYAYHDCEGIGSGGFTQNELEGHTSVSCDPESYSVTWTNDQPTISMVFTSCSIILEHTSPDGAPRVDRITITGSVESTLGKNSC